MLARGLSVAFVRDDESGVADRIAVEVRLATEDRGKGELRHGRRGGLR